jgi:hypothetical protein
MDRHIDTHTVPQPKIPEDIPAIRDAFSWSNRQSAPLRRIDIVYGFRQGGQKVLNPMEPPGSLPENCSRCSLLKDAGTVRARNRLRL